MCKKLILVSETINIGRCKFDASYWQGWERTLSMESQVYVVWVVIWLWSISPIKSTDLPHVLHPPIMGHTTDWSHPKQIPSTPNDKGLHLARWSKVCRKMSTGVWELTLGQWTSSLSANGRIRFVIMRMSNITHYLGYISPN